MMIDDRDEFGSEKDLAATLHALLNNNGVTALCLDLISMGIQDDVKIEAIKLLIAMLFKEGGNEAVQVIYTIICIGTTLQPFSLK